jgi:hypothetical protein
MVFNTLDCNKPGVKLLILLKDKTGLSYIEIIEYPPPGHLSKRAKRKRDNIVTD